MTTNGAIAAGLNATTRIAGSITSDQTCRLLQPSVYDGPKSARYQSVARKAVANLPAMHSLASRRIQLRLNDQSEVAVFDAESRQLRVSVNLAREMELAAEEVRWAFYESLGRWTLLMAPQVDITTANWTCEVLDNWVTSCALRPFLYLAWKNGCCPVGPGLPVARFRSAIESSAAAPKWGEALQRFFQALSGHAERIPNALERLLFASSGRNQIVGFRHTRDGVVLAVFGARSYRHLSVYNAPSKSVLGQQWLRFASNVLLDGENFAPPLQQAESRRCRLTPLQLVPCASAKIVDNRLPTNSVVRELLVPGRIPMTTKGANDAGWALLISSALIKENGKRVGATGRTGILFKDGMPVIEELDGIQHLLEVKGAGSVDGGMPSLMKRADGTWSPTGGLLRSYANDEYAALLQNMQNEQRGAKAWALLHCDSADLIRRPYLIGTGSRERRLEKWPPHLIDEARNRLAPGLGIVFRLTPSSERLSFFEYDEKPRGRRRFSIVDRISIYGEAIARLFQPGEMKAHLSAHLENLVSGDFGFFWQDFADLLPLYMSRGHYWAPDWHSRKALTMRLLNQTFFYVAKTAQVFREYFGVGYDEFSSCFYRAFTHELEAHWPLKPTFLSNLANMREPLRVEGQGITAFLWKGWIAADNFRWCTEHYDLPAAIFGAKGLAGADHEPVAPEIATPFLQAEQEFLSEAALPTGLDPKFLGPAARSLLAESLDSTRDLITRIAHRKLSVADFMLPYLTRSQQCALPRKVESWPK